MKSPPQPPLMIFSCFFATFLGKRGSFLSFPELIFIENYTNKWRLRRLVIDFTMDIAKFSV